MKLILHKETKYDKSLIRFLKRRVDHFHLYQEPEIITIDNDEV